MAQVRDRTCGYMWTCGYVIAAEDTQLLTGILSSDAKLKLVSNYDAKPYILVY